MKYLRYLFFALLFVFVGCKKDSVDGSSIKDFQTSINEMVSSLTTLEQTKFNEALYVLKTFAVEGKTDIQKLENLAKLLHNKKVPEIFSLADETAKKNNMEWLSTAPPSLGEMNIFQSITATELDPNDIKASALNIIVKPLESDSIIGAKALRITPVLVDTYGDPVKFSNAGLETTMEIFSNGARLSTAKNLMSDDEFKGFILKIASLPSDKVIDAKIDIKVSVKTTHKTYQLTKAGVVINRQVLKPVEEKKEEEEEKKEEDKTTDSSSPEKKEENTPSTAPVPTPTEKPEAAVNKFLNNLGNQNLKAAYEISENPNWGSYEKFSNPNFGFGAVKSISVKSVTTKSSSDKSATVNAVYQVQDKDGNNLLLNVTYGMKPTESGWKIINHKINSSEKQK